MTGYADPTARVGTDLRPLLAHVADAYMLGDIVEWSVLTTGYEDCNIDLTTEQVRVVVKVFARDRAIGIAARTAELITAALAAGVRHPRLHRDRVGDLVHSSRGHQVLVMDFVPGRTLYDLRRGPDPGELAGIMEQTVRIHAVDAHPLFVFDPWAITNLAPLAGQLGDVLDTEQHHHVTAALEETTGVDRDVLPVALIHADLTKGNVLLGVHDGAVSVLDFAVANRFPRVQELAVIAANLTHGCPDPLPVRVETIAELYSAAAVPLTAAERSALRVFARAAAAMELLGALAEWHLHGNRGPETEYLIGLGTAGLRDYANVS